MKKALAIIGIVLALIGMGAGVVVDAGMISFRDMEWRYFAWFLGILLTLCSTVTTNLGIILVGIATLLKEPKT